VGPVYASAGHEPGHALWDVDTERALLRDHAIFSSYIDKALPVVDFGCGTGRQNVALGQLYADVTGMDISAMAIDIARRHYRKENKISYH
jgi:2-polyprenyl-3-methyl-5-hydroxy-6-metoxy-1,4-benzoquinol methylase